VTNHLPFVALLAAFLVAFSAAASSTHWALCAGQCARMHFASQYITFMQPEHPFFPEASHDGFAQCALALRYSVCSAGAPHVSDMSAAVPCNECEAWVSAPAEGLLGLLGGL
jgi:hypothetical protein